MLKLMLCEKSLRLVQLELTFYDDDELLTKLFYHYKLLAYKFGQAEVGVPLK